MSAIEIIVIIAAAGVVLGVVIHSLIMRAKDRPTCGCDCASCKRSCGNAKPADDKEDIADKDKND